MSDSYSDYVRWGARRSSMLSAEDKDAFIEDFIEPLDVGFARLQEMEETRPRGKGILVAFQALSWIARYQDPFQPIRESIKRVRAKWNG